MTEEDFFAMVLTGFVAGCYEDNKYSQMLHKYGYVDVDKWDHTACNFYAGLVLKPFKIVIGENTLRHMEEGQAITLEFDEEYNFE